MKIYRMEDLDKLEGAGHYFGEMDFAVNQRAKKGEASGALDAGS